MLQWMNPSTYFRTSDIILMTLLAAAAKSLKSCRTLCDPIDSSPPGCSVHGILQARVLQWVAFLLQGIFPTQGWSPRLLRLLASAGRSFTPAPELCWNFLPREIHTSPLLNPVSFIVFLLPSRYPVSPPQEKASQFPRFCSHLFQAFSKSDQTSFCHWW